MQPTILNFEFKAKIDGRDALRKKLNELGAADHGIDRQIDTYFESKTGRLKLRQGNVENALIYYERKNIKGSKESRIYYEKLQGNNDGLLKAITNSNGILVKVEKEREIFFIENVKFHLDYVEGLGEFFEVEAIDNDGTIGTARLKEQVEYYISMFSITEQQMIAISYSDMLLEKWKKNFYIAGNKFFYEVMTNLDDLQVEGFEPTPDHLCYRVKSVEDYLSVKAKIKRFGKVISEEIISGREITIYKLKKPFKYHSHKVTVLELPAPKEGKVYDNAFEHAEFVTTKNIELFWEENQNIKFDSSGLAKQHNPELKIKITPSMSIKFHENSLALLIRREYLSKIDF